MNSETIQNRAEAVKTAVLEAAGANFGIFSAAGVVGRVRRLVVDFDRRRRLEFANRRAIAHLQSLTDQQLRDIGVARADIERAVRFGKHAI